MATTFTAKEQLVRSRLAALTSEEFARLRLMLDAVRVRTESRLVTVETERATLLARKQQLERALQHFAKANALETLRSSLQKGERLKVSPAAPAAVKTPAKKGPARKTPAKRPAAKTPGRRPGR